MKQEKASHLSFGDLQMQRRKVKSEFFNQINAVIDWDPLRALIGPAYAKGFSPTGRPCYDCMVLFRMELMRTWYGLSDGEIEEQVNDRLSFSRFAGVDTEARWVKKAGKCHFGYKRHSVVNQDGLVIAEEPPANESDIKPLVTPLEKAGLGQGTPVMADKGCDSSEHRKALSSMRLKGRIMHKAQKNRSLTERERAVNKAVSKVRYAVERTYGSMHSWFGAGVARYVGLAKTHAQHIMEAIAYNLYRTPGIIVSNCIR